MKTTLSTSNSSDSARTDDYLRRIEEARQVIASAEAVLVGAGAGFSTAAGLVYDGKKFRGYFADFIARFGITDLYTSSFYPYPSEEVRWAYWAKHVHMIRYAPPAMPLYRALLETVRAKEYFVITTNVDGQFRKAGLSPERIFGVQGDYGLMQCRKPCHDSLYSNEQAVSAILPAISDCSIPPQLVPVCPVCGGPMDIHVRADASFIQDKAWYDMADRYESFVSSYACRHIVFLELGVGFNTPTIIRYPFEQMTYRNPKAVLIRLNKDYPDAIAENRHRPLSFGEDVSMVIEDLEKE